MKAQTANCSKNFFFVLLSFYIVWTNLHVTNLAVPENSDSSEMVGYLVLWLQVSALWSETVYSWGNKYKFCSRMKYICHVNFSYDHDIYRENTDCVGGHWQNY